MSDDLPFSGLKVLDASQGVAAPHCGMLLAQHGADVVKLEPIGGDWGRAIGKTYGDLCAYGASVNRGKRSIAVDLKHDDGLAVAKRLASEADIVLESFRPGVMARFGLDYESVRAANPDVIYLSVSGYGQRGPYAKLPVTDSIMQAFSGIMTINRDKDGIPQRIGMIAIDVFTGLYAFQAVCPALYRRALRGGGARLEISLMQAAAAFQAGKMVEHTLEGAEPDVLGAPLGTFECADGYINMNARRDPHFLALCDLIGRPDLKSDERFTTSERRIANRAQLEPVVREALKTRTRDEWIAAFEKADILAAKVLGYDDFYADPHVRETAAVVWTEQAGLGSIPIPQVPGATPVDAGSPLATTPHIGQHTRDVLAEAGFSVAEIERLEAAGAIRAMAQKARSAAE